MSDGLPPGFEVERGTDLPEGFGVEAAPARKPRLTGKLSIRAPGSLAPLTLTGEAHDGDTFMLADGRRLRLYGADAPELDQLGWTRDLTPVAIGRQAKAIADGLVDPTGEVGSLHGFSYGRPVAPISERGEDVGESLIRSGNAVAAPKYMADDPQRRFEYMQAERLARLNRLGVHDVYAQTPAEFRAAPNYKPDRETEARFSDQPTPWAGLAPDVEKQVVAMVLDPRVPLTKAAAFAKEHGAILDLASAKRNRTDYQKTGKWGGVSYHDNNLKVLTNQGDGSVGATARGIGDGVLPNLLDEAGAVVDTLGGTDNRENIWNSDRRWADIWANNQQQNESIIGFDEQVHPYARLGGELAGGLVVPFGSGARTVPELARVGAAYGGVAGFGGGFGGDGGLADRLTGAVVNAGAGALITAGGGKALQLAGKLPGALGLRSAGAPTSEPPLTADGPSHDLPPGFVVEDAPANAMPMQSEPTASVSAPVREPDYLRMPGSLAGPARPLLRDASEAELKAAASGIEPRDVMPIASNEVGSVDEAVAKDAGRIVEAKAPDERTALTRRTVRNYRGEPVPKLGPVDLIGFLRLQGGLKPDELGELNALGLTNAARRDMPFVGQEARFGPLISAQGSRLDDAALAAWEAGYFPDLSERPDIDTLLQAVRDHTFGQRRRFLPEDLGEIEAHDAIRADRLDLDRQRSEVDGPVYVDRSAPAEEPAPFAPIEAYEDWPAETVKRAGNIRLDKLESPQDIARALHTVESRVGFDAATRGRVTQAETERLASELAMTPETLLSRRKGQALNAEEALAARQILAKSGNELVNLARRVQRLDHPGDEDLAAFQRALVRHAAIQEQVSGATAEAGRALQQFRMAAQSGAVARDVLSAVVSHGGGKDRLQDAANVLLDAVESGPGVFNTVVDKALKPKFRDKLVEVYINALLSGPQTHAVNILSNTLTSLGQLPEHAAAAGLGAIRRVAGKGEDAVLGSEVGARAIGLLQGAKEGMRLFAKAVHTGEPSDMVSKVEGQQFKAISGLKGDVVRIPTRLLNAEDELFKGIARRMELNGLAVRMAHQEGLRREAAKARIAELVEQPTPEMLAKSMDYARYVTFQSKLGPGGSKLAGITQDWPLAKLFLPFVRTPTNLLKFAVERSPAAPLLKEWRADFAAGGARRDLAMARAMIGTGVGMAVYQAALAGKITGSTPTDPAKAKLEYADGWQPYSIRVGDKWYSYKRLDPFSTTLGVAADLALLPEGMSERQREDKVTLLVASIMGNLANKTWLSGLSDITGALSEPDRKADKMIQRVVGAIAVPTAVAQLARTADPVARETDSVGEYVRSRIPGLSDDLLPRRDIWSAPVMNEGGVGPDIVSPIWQSTAKDDPVNRALLDAGVSVGAPSKKIGDRELSPTEYDRYEALAGPRMKAAAAQIVSSPEWPRMDDEAKQDAISKAFKQVRADARADLFGAPAAKPKRLPGSLALPPGFVIEGTADGLPAGFEVERQ